MGIAPALRVAIDLVCVPSRARIARSEPLPQGVVILLRIAAGDEAAERDAMELTGRSRDIVLKAAAFFIEQILLCPSADSYRVLGANAQATGSELRRNMALLLRWLHPDMDRQGERSVFATRVTGAWNDLKTAERRASYDEVQRASPRFKSTVKKNGKAGVNGKLVSGNPLHATARLTVSPHLGAPRLKGALNIYEANRIGVMHGGEKKSLLRRAWFFLRGGATY